MKKVGVLAGVLFLLFVFSILAAEDTTNWNKNFSSAGDDPDFANSVAIASNGDVYVVGNGWDLIGQGIGYDWWLKKFNSSGTEDITNWNKNFSSAGGYSDTAYSVAIASNGDVYVVGNGVNLASASSSSNWWLKKFNSSGTEDTINWNKNFSSAENWGDFAYSMAISTSDDVYISGYGVNLADSNTGIDWWLKKFNSGGTEDTINWDKKFSSAGSNSDVAYSVAIDSNNNVYAVGYRSVLADEVSSFDWWLKKFNSSGTEDATNWNKNFSSDGNNADVAYSVAAAPNGDIYVVGYGTNLLRSDSNIDWWLKKFNSGGTEDTINWDKKFSSDGSNVDTAFSVSIAPNGDVYVAGYGWNLTGQSSGYDWWLKKFNSNGIEDTTNWNKNFSSAGGGTDYANSVAIASGDVYVAGYGVNLASASSSVDWWVKKFVNDEGCQYQNPDCGNEEDCINNQCQPRRGCQYHNPDCGRSEECVNNNCVLRVLPDIKVINFKFVGTINVQDVYELIVRNQGEAPAENLAWKVFYTSATVPELRVMAESGSAPIPVLAPGKEVAIYPRFRPLCLTHLKAVVDPFDTIMETIESNNAAELEVELPKFCQDQLKIFRKASLITKGAQKSFFSKSPPRTRGNK